MHLVFHIDNLYTFIDLFEVKELLSVEHVLEEITLIFPEANDIYLARLESKFSCIKNVKITTKKYQNDDINLKLFVNWLLVFSQHIKNKSQSVIYFSNATHGIYSNLIASFISRSASRLVNIGHSISTPNLINKTNYKDRSRKYPKGVSRPIQYSQNDLENLEKMTDQEFDCDFDESKIDILYCHSHSWAKQYANYLKNVVIISPKIHRQKREKTKLDQEINLLKKEKLKIIFMLDIFQKNDFLENCIKSLVKLKIFDKIKAVDFTLKLHPRNLSQQNKIIKDLIDIVDKYNFNIIFNYEAGTALMYDLKEDFDIALSIPSGSLFAFSFENYPLTLIDYDYFETHAKLVGYYQTPNIHEFIPSVEDKLPIFVISDKLDKPVSYTSVQEIIEQPKRKIYRQNLGEMILNISDNIVKREL